MDLKKQHFKRSLKIHVKLTSNFIRTFMTQNFFTIFPFFCTCVHQLQLPNFLIAQQVPEKKSSKNGQSLLFQKPRNSAQDDPSRRIPPILDRHIPRSDKGFSTIPKIPRNMTFWLVVEPTHLKHMLVKMGASSPTLG